MRARSLVLTAWRRERACGELSADRRFLAGHAGVETRTSVQVLAARQKSSFGRPAGLQLAHVDLECRRNLTVCWCLRTVEGVPTLRSSVPPIGDCVRGVRFRVRQLRSTHRGNTEGYGMCMLSRARAYLRADSRSPTWQEKACSSHATGTKPKSSPAWQEYIYIPGATFGRPIQARPAWPHQL